MPGGASSNGHSFDSGVCGACVGGDGVDGAVGEAGAHRGDVLRTAQRRVYLEHRVEARGRLVGEGEVVRCDLGGDGQAAPFASRTISTVPAAEQCRKCTGVPVAAASSMSRGDDDRLGDRRPAGDAEAARPLAFVHGSAGGEGLVLRVLGRPPRRAATWRTAGRGA